MSRSSRSPATRWISCCLLALATSLSPLEAQIPQTTLNSLSPPGGQVGQAFDAVIFGTDLDFVDRLIFSHPGITAAQKTREQDGRQIPIDNQFAVSIASDVPVGIYEARAIGYFGVSNPRAFVVGDRPELTETEPNNDRATAQELPVGAVVNGLSNGTADVDFFKIRAAAGQRVVVAADARRIDSRMQVQLELFDASGRRLERSQGGYRGDPLLDFTSASEADYFVRVTDFTYRGGNDYFYRLSASTAPFIDFVLPPSGPPGTTTSFTLYGRNLPGGAPSGMNVAGIELQKLDVSITLPPRDATSHIDDHLSPEESSIESFSYRLSSPAGWSNAVSIHFADAPVVREVEPNDAAAQVQTIAVPGEVGGQFQQKLDVDLFQFEAKAGEVYYIDVYGQRLGLLTDPRFVLEQVTRNEQGEEQLKRLTDQDDTALTIGGEDFNTRHRDPGFRFDVPADGVYRLILSDRYRESRGDPALVYRLSIRRESPDYRLVAFASVPNPQPNQPGSPGVIRLLKGGNVEIDVLAHRLDGFDGNIRVTVEGLPEGVTSPGAVIGSGQNSARLIFSAKLDAAVTVSEIRVLGEAQIDDPGKVRAAAQAQAGIKPALDALPNLKKALDEAQQKFDPQQTATDAAKKASADKPDDEGLKNKAAEEEQKLATAQAALEKAKSDLAAGEQKLAEARTAVQTADNARREAVRNVKREASSASLIWQGTPNAGQSTVSRLTRGLTISVMEMTSSFQPVISQEPVVLEVNQSRQLLLPVKLERREGFDANVVLNFAGFDPGKSKLQVENKPLNKGENDGVRRVFIPKDSPPGAWTLYLSGQAQANLERNPLAIARAKSAQDEAVAKVTASEEANKNAIDAQQKADAAMKDADAKFKQSDQAAQTADKAAKDAQAAVIKAEQDAKAADEAAKKADADLKQKQETLAKAKEELQNDAENQAKIDAVKQAEEQVAGATTAQTQAAEALTKANTALTVAQDDLKKKTDELAKANADKEAAQKALDAAQEAKTKADQDAKTAADTLKAAQTAKTQADTNFNNVNNANKARNVNLVIPSNPILVIVKPAPVELTANVPNNGNLKKGTPLEVKVSIKRINGFEGPVSFKLPLPPGVTGLRCDPLTLAADQSEGTLLLHADADAKDGKLENMVIQAEMAFDGQAAVDVPINLNVTN